MAINSCALIRTKFLEEIGGFNKNFPLDGLDHWWCGEAQRLQRKLFVMEGTIEHDLSVSNFGENVTAARYQSIVDSEVTLYRNHRATLTRALFLLQLVRRSIRFFFTMKDRRFAKISLNGALRLFSGA
jgi:GT2 family glycosyltransferase